MKNTRGFTLIEIIVAIAIIGIMFSFMVFNFRGNQSMRDVRNDALVVLDGLKRAQTMALSGSTINGQTPSFYEFVLSNPLSNGQYILRSVSVPAGQYVIDTKKLSNSKIDIIDASGLHYATDMVVDFAPPRAVATITVGGVATSSALLKIVHNNGSSAAYIKINGISGRMDIFTSLPQ